MGSRLQVLGIWCEAELADSCHVVINSQAHQDTDAVKCMFAVWLRSIWKCIFIVLLVTLNGWNVAQTSTISVLKKKRLLSTLQSECLFYLYIGYVPWCKLLEANNLIAERAFLLLISQCILNLTTWRHKFQSTLFVVNRFFFFFVCKKIVLNCQIVELDLLRCVSMSG